MVNTTQITKIAAGLRALAQSCDDSRAQIESAGVNEALSSNYTSALRGCELIIRFVNGLAGTATIAKYMDDLKPLLDELRAEKSEKLQVVAEDVERFKKSRKKKNDEN